MPASSSPSTDGSELHLANEFASIRLRKVKYGNAYRIELHSDRHNRTVLLDPMALDAIARLTPEQISGILTLVMEKDQ